MTKLELEKKVASLEARLAAYEAASPLINIHGTQYATAPIALPAAAASELEDTVIDGLYNNAASGSGIVNPGWNLADLLPPQIDHLYVEWSAVEGTGDDFSIDRVLKAVKVSA